MDARRAVEQAACDSYGRLLAFLGARWRDVAAAEDALADAFHAALERWPRDGLPDKPEAWLLTTARHRLIDGARHARVQAEAAPDLLAAADEAQELAEEEGAVFPDERLKLLFVCAHPAIDAAARTPLMLQTVLGLDAARIASAFLVKPAAMGQRLSRAKAKIRDARIAFELPREDELAPRLEAVLEAIYAAYGSGWDDVAGADARRKGLAEEALQLGRLLQQLLPEQPEAQGLLALMLHCEARREARRSGGAYVPLSGQDVRLWSQPLLREAEEVLAAAERAGRLGRFQLEAAIQSVHARRAWSGMHRLGGGGPALRGAGALCAHRGRAARPRRGGGRGARRGSRLEPAAAGAGGGAGRLPALLGAARAPAAASGPRARSAGCL
jgi:RNA polymerase sigma-70 factor (ECF subfamily)